MSKADSEREKRLAVALRENLRRRKSQARQAARPDTTKETATPRREIELSHLAEETGGEPEARSLDHASRDPAPDVGQNL